VIVLLLDIFPIIAHGGSVVIPSQWLKSIYNRLTRLISSVLMIDLVGDVASSSFVQQLAFKTLL